MQIGKPLRTIVVEPLELPMEQPTREPEPEPIQSPEPEPEPEQTRSGWSDMARVRARSKQPGIVAVRLSCQLVTAFSWNYRLVSQSSSCIQELTARKTRAVRNQWTLSFCWEDTLTLFDRDVAVEREVNETLDAT